MHLRSAPVDASTTHSKPYPTTAVKQKPVSSQATMKASRTPLLGPPASLVACLGCKEAEARARRAVVPGLVWRTLGTPAAKSKAAWAYPDLAARSYSDGGWPLVAVLVMTSPSRAKQRDAIRRTWGLQSNYPNRTFRVVFFMNANAAAHKELKVESKLYKDLVVQHMSSFVPQPVSSLSSLVAEWVPCSIWAAKLVLVLRRDDCLVNVRALLSGSSHLLNDSARIPGPGRPAVMVLSNDDSEATGGAKRLDVSRSEGRGNYRADDVRALNAASLKGHRVGGHTAESEPCALLAVGNDAFVQQQPFFADESDDKLFFSGALARMANMTVGRVGDFYPCSRADITARDYRWGWITRCGLSPEEVLTRYAKIIG
ncbi:uncharacterized protein LOC144178677 [Haemaphysalis longicornis]